ncbi:MAG: amidohydrolase [Chloroflexi bacterium]|nr:amidohydrolase [Chloroflexota bacterium]MBU1660020.1 amidohydrolase [Chloroflexota bacterium]
MPDMILYNGKLHTQDSNYPQATAVAVCDGRILAVGMDTEIQSLAGNHTRQIDLDGRRVLPGLTDSHFHYYDWALNRRQLELADTASLADVHARVAKVTAKTPPDNWILGQGWNETRWPNPRLLTRADLDDLTPANPAILWRSDMHLAVANSLALREAHINAETPDPSQGVIDRDASGQPTGVLRELAINLVREVIPPPTEVETVAATRDGFTELHRLGLTGAHDYRIMGGADGPLAFRAYQHLHTAGELTLRMWMLLPGEQLNQAIELGLRTGFGDDYLRVGHVKFFSDGGQGARTAWMLEPYEDTASCGMPLTPMDEIADAVRRAHKAGLAVAIHAIGDRANRELVTAFEQVLSSEQVAAPSAPHRIEHAQTIRPEDVRRLGRLGVVASVQPIHVPDDYPMIEKSVGPRGRWTYAFRDLLAAGVPLAFGSDCPVANPNPMWGIHAAVTRQMRDGTPTGGWYPGQCLSVAEAVWGYTMGAALVSGRQADLGSLTPGKLADLVVLDRDIFTIDPMEIAHTRVMITIFDGQVIYRN